MTEAELIKLIRDGENSAVEFKRDGIHQDDLAKEFSALLNFEGGYILLGVEDNGSITGLEVGRKTREDWVMNIARHNLQPGVIPHWRCVTLDDGKVVGAVGLPADSPGKPYKAKRGNAWVTFIRVGYHITRGNA